MKRPVVVACARTPIGRAHAERGWFRNIRSDDLATSVVKAVVARSGVDPKEIDDLVLGCAFPEKEQGLNVGRAVSLMAGLPVTVSGATVNRWCGSSLQALNQAAHSIIAGAEDAQIVGGLEHMQHIPMDTIGEINPKLFQQTSKAAMMMGVTAEFLAQAHGISRQDQDSFALRSHQKAAAAHANKEFAKEIIPLHGHDEAGQRIVCDSDQCVRADSSLEALAALAPAFTPKGTVTAGNSSPLNDGAAALLVMSEEKAKTLGLKPLVRVVATAAIGVEPSVMGTGPVPATKKALQRAGMDLKDIDLVELNEAFAAQSLACLRLLKLDEGKVNVRGGSIAIGHPLGASGARISTTLIHAMIDRGARTGLATMCIGMGQGIATIFERV